MNILNTSNVGEILGWDMNHWQRTRERKNKSVYSAEAKAGS